MPCQIAGLIVAGVEAAEVRIVLEQAAVMAEQHLRMLSGGFVHIGLEAKAIADDHVAAVTDQLADGVGAGAVIRNVFQDGDLMVFNAQILLHFLQANQMAVVKTHIRGIADHDHADLQFRRIDLFISKANSAHQRKSEAEHCGNQFFHVRFSLD